MYVCTNKPVGNVSIFKVLNTTRAGMGFGMRPMQGYSRLARILVGVVCVYGTARIII